MGVRANYLEENTQIPITDFNTYEMLQPGYTGGAVDVFKPTNPDNKKVNVYDVNSMYPHVMNKYEFPVGIPITLTSARWLPPKPRVPRTLFLWR